MTDDSPDFDGRSPSNGDASGSRVYNGAMQRLIMQKASSDSVGKDGSFSSVGLRQAGFIDSQLGE